MVTNIDRTRLLTLIEEGAQVVDVLPEREYTGQHIPGAVNIHLRQLTAKTVTVLRRDKPVVVY
ncbi:MAG: rhodanese-like domain-containing protein [Acidobacteria bacterium]|nr:rhodanese-like domain-containing protein [Acidobacteriota bacterium]